MEYASNGTGDSAPIPLGSYRLPLRVQVMVTVNLPRSSRPTSNRIIDPPFCLKRKARANTRAFPIEAQVLLS